MGQLQELPTFRVVVQKILSMGKIPQEEGERDERYDLQHTESAPPHYKTSLIPNIAQRKDFRTLIQNQIYAKTRTRTRDKDKEWEERQRWKERRATPDIRLVTAMTDRP
jgi:hypothetical protein